MMDASWRQSDLRHLEARPFSAQQTLFYGHPDSIEHHLAMTIIVSKHTQSAYNAHSLGIHRYDQHGLLSVHTLIILVSVVIRPRFSHQNGECAPWVYSSRGPPLPAVDDIVFVVARSVFDRS